MSSALSHLYAAVAYALMRFTGDLPYAGLVLLTMGFLMIAYVLLAGSRFCGGSVMSVLRQLVNPLSIVNIRPQ